MALVLPVLGVALLGSAVMAGPRGPSPREAERLAMAAQASGRPPECRGDVDSSSRGRSLTIWDRAKQPHLQRYCDLLGRGQRKLDSAPAAAREAARLADQVLPGKAGPWVLIGRAHVRLRDYPQALRDFHKARSLDPRSIEDAPSLHDLAIAQRQAGKLADAMTTYRVLVPRLVLLPSTDDRVAVLVEAASLAMSRGPTGLQEATALLKEARTHPLSKHDPLVLGMLALALDRAGMHQEANAVLDEIHRANLAGPIAVRDAHAVDLLTHADDWYAIVALVLERDDRSRAIVAWQRYLEETTASSFAQHAKHHLEALKRATPTRYAPR